MKNFYRSYFSSLENANKFDTKDGDNIPDGTNGYA